MQIVFTQHAHDRIVKRKVDPFEVFEAIRRPDFIQKKHGKLFYRKTLPRGSVEICCILEGNILKVLTLYWE